MADSFDIHGTLTLDGSQMTAEIEKNIKALRSFGIESRKAYDVLGPAGQLARVEYEKLHKTTVETTKSTAQMGSEVVSLARKFLGPLGLAISLRAVINEFSRFTDYRVQLRFFAEDARLTVPQLMGMRYGMTQLGLSADEANKHLGTVTSKLKEMVVNPWGSQLYQSIAWMPGEGRSWADKIRHDAESGDMKKAIDSIVALYNTLDERGKLYIESQTGLPSFFLKNWKDIRDAEVQGMALDAEARKQFLKDRADFWQFVERAETIGANVLYKSWRIMSDQVDWYSKHVRSQYYNPSTLMDSRNWSIEEMNKYLEHNPHPLNKLPGGKTQDTITTQDYLYRWLNPSAEIPGVTAKEFEDRVRYYSSTIPHRAFGGSVYGPTIVGERGPELFVPNSGGQIVPGLFGRDPFILEDISNQVEESNTVLKDIRDILEETFGPLGGGSDNGTGTGGGGGGGGGWGGGGGGGPADRGPAPSGSRGDPVEFRQSKKLYDPMTATGLSGALGSNSRSLGPGRHGGVDLMGPRGSTVYASAEGKISHIGTDRFGQQTVWIDHGDGTSTVYLHMGNIRYPVGTPVRGGQAIGTSGAAGGAEHIEVQLWHGTPFQRGSYRYSPREVFDWGKNKLPKGGLQNLPRPRPTSLSGDVRGSTFDDRFTASGLPSSVPGIALPSGEGLGQLYEITTPDGRKFVALQTDKGPAAWTGRGIDINRPLAEQMGYTSKTFPTGEYFQYRRLDGARNNIDRQFGQWPAAGGGDLGTASIMVDFRNVPPGTRTNADIDGAFKRLKIQRSPQAAYAGGSNADYNDWSYDQ